MEKTKLQYGDIVMRAAILQKFNGTRNFYCMLKMITNPYLNVLKSERIQHLIATTAAVNTHLS